MTERGFTDVPVQSAHAFRAIMQAMARPGRIMALDAALAAPSPLLPSAAAMALTLCDFQTPLWLGPQLRSQPIMHYLRFHTGAPITDVAGEAQFAFVTAGDMLPNPALFLQGSHEYPDRSATLVIQVAGFLPGAVDLSGPGLANPLSFGVAGLDQRFWTEMAENHSRFPVGIDVIFAAPGMIAALPRSTAIHLRETV